MHGLIRCTRQGDARADRPAQWRTGKKLGMNMPNDQYCDAHFRGQGIDLPMYSPTLGPDVIDIRKLYAQADVFTFDPGFTSTASCESAITYIDGDKGELLYRGYPIEQLAERSTHLEVCYLLLYGELPTAANWLFSNRSHAAHHGA
jgi:hypothetical protein